MKTAPIQPAQLAFDAQPGQPPSSVLFGDIYHPRAGALVQARHVFLQGNELPARWQGRARFVVLETGFGLGNNFLATWHAWRADPQRCERLHFVAIEKHPVRVDDLARAHQGSELQPLVDQLLQAWPPLTPNLHGLGFEGGRVQLLLALGDAAAMLPALRLRFDALYLDGFAPARNPDIWQPRVIKALGRRAAPGATAATWTAAHAVRDSLASAGFETRLAAGTGGKRDITLAHFAPRFVARSAPGMAAPVPAPPPRSAVVIGAGLAGTAVARALALQGLQVTVLESQAEAASQASGNPAGLFHGSIAGDDGPYSRLYRAAALAAAREYRQALHRHETAAASSEARVAGQADGLLRLDLRPGGLAEMQALAAAQGWPADYVQPMSAREASAKAGVALPAPAWFYPGGGWISPPQWVRHALQTPGVQLHTHCRVDALGRSGRGWRVQFMRTDQAEGGANSGTELQADVVVLAHAGAADRLLQSMGHAPLPLSHTRGQVSHLASRVGAQLKMPIAGDGYALPLPLPLPVSASHPASGGAARPGLLCGATRAEGQPDGDHLPPVLAKEHAHNLLRLQRLLAMDETPDARAAQGRAAWRLNSIDRLPIAGAVARIDMPPGQRMDQARLLPREPGLFVLTALGARGLTLAPLMGQLVAAMACDAPWPLEQDLVDAVDPARWRVRQARRSDQKAGR